MVFMKHSMIKYFFVAEIVLHAKKPCGLSLGDGIERPRLSSRQGSTALSTIEEDDSGT